jgi:PAS domain S-box-containing protein
MAQGLRAARFAMFSVGVTGAALLLLVLGVLETMVVSRINRLAETMSRIGKTGDMAIRLPVVGKDEISLFSEDINRMLGDLQKAERSLRDNERRYRAMFENAGDALVVLKDQQVIDCNTRALALFGGSREQIVGCPFASFLPPMQADGEESRSLWNALMDKVRREGASVAEWRCRRLDGSILETEVNLSIVTMGSEVLLQMVFRDLTVRRQAEADRRQLHQQMVQGQKLESLGVLAGGIAHDFNNLLVAVMGNADLALQDMEQSAPGHSFVEEIKKAAVRASDLTSQLLAYSGKGKFVIKVVDLNLVVREMANLLQVSITKKAIVRYELAETLPSVEVDVAQFRQILMNLITNASDAIGDTPGTITIRTGIVDADRSYLSQTYINEGLQEGAYAFLEVSDTGCGMDAETKGRIFDPFYTTKASGRGLGLAAVLGIIRGHQGAIHVYSEQGRGSTFKVLLPLSRKEIERLPQSIIPETHSWRASGTILVADDEESMRSISRMMLEKIGFRVVTAVDGQDAVDKFREHADSVVAVLLDLTMPRLDGEQTFQELLCIRPDVKVILCSGYNESEACRRFGDMKLAGFVQKPFEYHAIVNLLKDVVTGKSA